MYCKNCGYQLPDSAKFCSFCGAPQDDPLTKGVDESLQIFETPVEVPQAASSENDKTVSIFDQAPQAAPAAEEKPAPQNIYKPDVVPEAPPVTETPIPQPPKKKKKKGLIALILVIILAVGGYFAYPTVKNYIDYNKAVKAYEAGDPDTAMPIFQALSENEFKDSKWYVYTIKYEKAEKFVKQNDYANAIPILAELEPVSFRDTKKYLDDYYTIMLTSTAIGDYDTAFGIASAFSSAGIRNGDEAMCYVMGVKLLEEGHNYDAYCSFNAANAFEDAEELAESCILDTPSTGTVATGSGYSSGSVDLKILAPDYWDVYVKVYKGDELSYSAYIKAGETYTKSLSSGTYHINVGYGYGNWYGELDMFGDDGDYEKLILTDDGYDMYFESNMIYTLTLMTAENGNVGSNDTDREGM